MILLGENLHNTWFDKKFLVTTGKNNDLFQKNDKLYFIKIKAFLIIAKEM
jgi:hypothetical protein